MKERNFIVTIIIVILINILALCLWFYLLSFIKEQSNMINDEREKLAMNEKELQNATSLKGLINEINDDKKIIDTFFINKESAINFIENLESIARQTGASVKIENANIEGAGGDSFSFQINLEGEFRQIFQYLILMENTHYLIDVKKTTLIKSDKNWQADFEILLKGFGQT